MIDHLIIIFLQIVGVYAAFRDGSPFGWVKQNLEDKIHYEYHWVLNPFFNCITCMGGLWGFSLALLEFDYGFIGAEFMAVACIGLGYIVTSIIDTND